MHLRPPPSSNKQLFIYVIDIFLTNYPDFFLFKVINDFNTFHKPIPLIYNKIGRDDQPTETVTMSYHELTNNFTLIKNFTNTDKIYNQINILCGFLNSCRRIASAYSSNSSGTLPSRTFLYLRKDLHLDACTLLLKH